MGLGAVNLCSRYHKRDLAFEILVHKNNNYALPKEQISYMMAKR